MSFNDPKLEDDISDKELFDKAIVFRDEGRFAEAITIIEKLLPKYPENAAIFSVYGHLNWELGNLKKAIEVFQIATNLYPVSEIISLGLFHTLWEDGKREGAFKELKRFMSISYSNDYMEIVRELNNPPARPVD